MATTPERPSRILAAPATPGNEGLGPRVVQALCRVLLRLLCRIDVDGLENVPARGPCLLVFNHVSNFDPPLIYSVLQRRDIVALVAAEYRANALFRPFVEAAGSVWLKRGSGDWRAMRRALAALAAGKMVGLAPEGGRSPSGGLRAAKSGAAVLALRSSAPVLPVAVTNSNLLHRSWRRLRRPRVSITFGEVFSPRELDGHAEHDPDRMTTGVMERLADLLPSDYRGVYGNGTSVVVVRGSRLGGSP